MATAVYQIGGPSPFPIITDFRALWPVLAPAQQKPKEVSYGR